MSIPSIACLRVSDSLGGASSPSPGKGSRRFIGGNPAPGEGRGGGAPSLTLPRRTGGGNQRTLKLPRIRIVRFAFAVVWVTCVLSGAARAEGPNGEPAANPDPELERRAFKIDPNFQINLFASDPMVEKPIQVNWDATGRLWCATSETYPQLKPGQTPNDKIYILEDSDGQGKADKSTVFADGLFIPTAVIPGDGGAYVTNSTEILHLKDTTGTGKADVRRVVLAGFGTEDTHHIVHTLHWGPDGRLYFLQSIYIHSHLETPRGLRTLLGSGVWRFNTRTLDLSVYSRGLVNPWGIVWDRWGDTFETDGAGFQGINYAFPGAGFESAVGMDRVLPGLNPSSPKYASAEILSGRNIPDEYQGDILTNDFRANRVVRFKLSENGAGFTSKQMPDFLTSTDTAFRPVDIKMGPDGAIYICDWYNPIIQHGEVDFRDPRRDHVHGRIWRVTARGRDLAPRSKIEGASIPQLLDLLKEPEDFTRMQARLALRERDPAQVLPALKAWVRRIKSRGAEADHERLEALWTCENLNAVEPELLDRVLKSDEPRARAAAARAVGNWADQLADPLGLLAPLLKDDSPRVRLEAVRALAAVRSPQSVVIALRALDKPMDPFLEYALWLTCNDLESVWMPAFQAGTLTDWEKADHLNYALRAVKSLIAFKSLVEQLTGGQTPQEARPGIVNLIENIGGPDEANTLLNLALGEARSEARTQLLAALIRFAADRHVQPTDRPERIEALLTDSDSNTRAQGIVLAGLWKIESTRPELEKIAQATQSADPPRLYVIAMQSLGELGGQPSRTLLESLSTPSQRPDVREAAVAGLALIDVKAASSKAAGLLASGTPNPGFVLATFTSREGGADALASALTSVKLPPDTAKLALRFLRETGQPNTSLTNVLVAAAGFSGAPVHLSPQQMNELIARMRSSGDASRGERVFRRADVGCYQCHAIAGAGGWLGPDLSSIGASSPVDYLIDSVLDPNKAIKDGFQGFSVVTNGGDVFSGIKVRQDAKQLVLRTNTEQEVPLALSDIKAQKDIGSLMPNGLADFLTHQEFLDLIKFLSQLGKPGPYGPTTAQYIRRWRVMDPVLPTLSSPNTNGIPSAAALDRQTWDPAYSLVSGELPADALWRRGSSVAYARGQIEVTAPGKVRLLLNRSKGVLMCVDDNAVDVGDEMTVDFPIGIHTLTFRFGLSQRRGGEGLRVEVADVPGSSAHAQPVGGK